jgi:hypothetical protein
VSVPSLATENTEIEPPVPLELLVTTRKVPLTAGATETGLVPTWYGEPVIAVSCPVVLFRANADRVADV